MAPSESERTGVLRRLGLDRRELRAWALYDWANSAFITVVVSAVFPPFFVKVAAEGLPESEANRRFTLVTTVALAIIAVASPLLGAIADRAPVKKKMIAGWSAVGALGTAAMGLIGAGDWALALGLFALTNVAANGAFIAYDALLPHIAARDEVDRVSTAGYALGYLGGGLLLVAGGLAIGDPGRFGLADQTQAVQALFVVTGGWWALFTLPLLHRVPEPRLPPERRARGGRAVRLALGDLRHTLRELRRYRQATLLLVAFLVYNDGIGTIYRMATAYGAEIGLDTGEMISALVLVQLVGIPATFAFGWLAGRIGTRPAILLGLVLYGVVSVLGYFMTTGRDFFVLAALVGLVQGGTQALSRSLFASMIPRDRSSEFFGLFAVFEKFAGILGPAVFAAALSITGSSRPAILSIIAFFVVGGALLLRVDVEAGRAAASAADEAADAGARAATDATDVSAR
jgi:UMF1 family MFS transporter